MNFTWKTGKEMNWPWTGLQDGQDLDYVVGRESTWTEKNKGRGSRTRWKYRMTAVSKSI
jgi:hypothetical protein